MGDLSFLLKLSRNRLLLDACSFQGRVIKEPEEKRREKSISPFWHVFKGFN